MYIFASFAVHRRCWGLRTISRPCYRLSPENGRGESILSIFVHLFIFKTVHLDLLISRQDLNIAFNRK